MCDAEIETREKRPLVTYHPHKSLALLGLIVKFHKVKFQQSQMLSTLYCTWKTHKRISRLSHIFLDHIQYNQAIEHGTIALILQ